MGGQIAGEEVERAGNLIVVNDPVFVSVKSDGTGYDIKPIQFVAAGEPFRMYTSGLLGETDMPAGMLPWFEKYQEQRVQEGKSTPDLRSNS